MLKRRETGLMFIQLSSFAFLGYNLKQGSATSLVSGSDLQKKSLWRAGLIIKVFASHIILKRLLQIL